MKGYIYKYTFPNGKVYIGQTRRPIEIRHKEHLSPTVGPLNPAFWKAYQEVGTPTLSIIEAIECDDVTDLVNALNLLETMYIQQERATDPAYGYNRISSGTTSSHDINILNKEYARLCQEADDRNRAFVDQAVKKYCQEGKEGLDENERIFIEEYLENNNLFSIEHKSNSKDRVEKEFASFMFEEAVDYALWRINDEDQERIAEYISENADEIIRAEKEKQIIQQLDKDGNVVKEYLTSDEIREAFKVARIDNIINVLKGRQKTAYGFRWRYKSND